MVYRILFLLGIWFVFIGCDLDPRGEFKVGDDMEIQVINGNDSIESFVFKYVSGIDPRETFRNKVLDSLEIHVPPLSDTFFVWHDPLPDTGIGFAVVLWEDEFDVLAGYERFFFGGNLQVFISNEGDSLLVEVNEPGL